MQLSFADINLLTDTMNLSLSRLMTKYKIAIAWQVNLISYSALFHYTGFFYSIIYCTHITHSTLSFMHIALT